MTYHTGIDYNVSIVTHIYWSGTPKKLFSNMNIARYRKKWSPGSSTCMMDHWHRQLLLYFNGCSTIQILPCTEFPSFLVPVTKNDHPVLATGPFNSQSWHTKIYLNWKYQQRHLQWDHPTCKKSLSKMSHSKLMGQFGVIIRPKIKGHQTMILYLTTVAPISKV